MPIFYAGGHLVYMSTRPKGSAGGLVIKMAQVQKTCILPFTHSRAAGETDTVFPGVIGLPGHIRKMRCSCDPASDP